MHLIYRYTSPSGKCYIGKTKESREGRRKYEHINDSKNGSSTKFHNSLRKYGEDNFKYEVLMRGIPSEIVNGLEVIYINLHNPEYNITTGGDGIDSETAKLNALKRWSDEEDSKKRINSMRGKKKTITKAFRAAQSNRTSNRNKVYNSIEYTCPHCQKVGKGPNMKRYHFDNCKTVRYL